MRISKMDSNKFVENISGHLHCPCIRPERSSNVTFANA
jgi:hypothetical protein